MFTTPTITTDSATRDLLARELQYVLRSAGSDLDCLDCFKWIARDEAANAIERATWAFGVLDVLGWDEDDPRSRYELTADARLAAWLHRVRKSMGNALSDDRESLGRLEAGDEGYCWVGYSMGESVARARQSIESQEAGLALIDRLIGEIDELIGAVA